MRIIVDSREQAPFDFRAEIYKGVEVEVGSLATGDYSLKGLEDVVAVERKSLDDLIGCLSTGRERFERELARSRGLNAFMVCVESSWEDLVKARYRSRMDPHAAAQSVLSFAVKYRCGFHFAGSRPAAAYSTWGFLKQYLGSAEKRLKAIVKAHGEELEQAV